MCRIRDWLLFITGMGAEGARRDMKTFWFIMLGHETKIIILVGLFIFMAAWKGMVMENNTK